MYQTPPYSLCCYSSYCGSHVCNYQANAVCTIPCVMPCRKNSLLHVDSFGPCPTAFFPSMSLDESAVLDPNSAYLLESLRQDIISQPPLCASKTLFSAKRHVQSRECKNRSCSISTLKSFLGSTDKAEMDTLIIEKKSIERRMKIIKFLQKSRIRRAKSRPNRRYEGRSRSASGRVRNKGKFMKEKKSD